MGTSLVYRLAISVRGGLWGSQLLREQYTMSTKVTSSKGTNVKAASKAASSKGEGETKQAAVKETAFKIVVKREGAKVFDRENRDGNRVGLTTGLLITGWYNEVFDSIRNGAKWSDETLANEVRKEFPQRGEWQAIGAYRSYYNSGKHGLGEGGKPLNEAKKARQFKVSKSTSKGSKAAGKEAKA